jgi:hypothetical protein
MPGRRTVTIVDWRVLWPGSYTSGGDVNSGMGLLTTGSDTALIARVDCLSDSHTTDDGARLTGSRPPPPRVGGSSP